MRRVEVGRRQLEKIISAQKVDDYRSLIKYVGNRKQKALYHIVEHNSHRIVIESNQSPAEYIERQKGQIMI